MRIRIGKTQERRWLKWWWRASDRWSGGRATVVLIAVLLSLFIPGVWTSWFGSVVIILLLIVALGLALLVGVRAYYGKD
jgi:hypothetical protein